MRSLNLQRAEWRALRSAAMKVPEEQRSGDLISAVEGIDAVLSSAQKAPSQRKPTSPTLPSVGTTTPKKKSKGKNK